VCVCVFKRVCVCVFDPAAAVVVRYT